MLRPRTLRIEELLAMATASSVMARVTTFLPTSTHFCTSELPCNRPTTLCSFRPLRCKMGAYDSLTKNVSPTMFEAAPFGIYGSQAPAMSPQRSAEADVMGLLLRQRTVVLGYEMNDFVADAIISQLLLLDANDPTKPIRLFINCPGGSVSAAMGIYDAIQLCRADVSTIAFGLAASTASIILAGGSKGKRYAMPNARIMVHQPMGGASGQAIDVEIQAKEIMYHKQNFIRILSEITRRPYEQVEKDIDRDRYMSPVEALEYGIIDAVIDREAIIPLAPVPEKVLRRPEMRDAEADPLKFLTPVIPDDEIF